MTIFLELLRPAIMASAQDRDPGNVGYLKGLSGSYFKTILFALTRARK